MINILENVEFYPRKIYSKELVVEFYSRKISSRSPSLNFKINVILLNTFNSHEK